MLLISSKDHNEGFPEYFKDISGIDILVPEVMFNKVLNVLVNLKVICGVCGSRKTIQIKTDKDPSKEFATIKCSCGCTVVYPPRKNRDYLYFTKFISADKYDKDKSKQFKRSKGNRKIKSVNAKNN